MDEKTKTLLSDYGMTVDDVFIAIGYAINLADKAGETALGDALIQIIALLKDDWGIEEESV